MSSSWARLLSAPSSVFPWQQLSFSNSFLIAMAERNVYMYIYMDRCFLKCLCSQTDVFLNFTCVHSLASTLYLGSIAHFLIVFDFIAFVLHGRNWRSDVSLTVLLKTRGNQRETVGLTAWIIWFFKIRNVNRHSMEPHLPDCCCGSVCIWRETIPPSQGWTKIRLHLQDVNETCTAAFWKQVTQIAFGTLCVSANLLALCLIPQM